jgi:hypothetical protein
VWVVGCDDSAVFDARADCTTCADSDSDGYTICKHARSDEDDNTNIYEDSHMDKYTGDFRIADKNGYCIPFGITDEYGNKVAYIDSYITTDKDGHAWIHVNGRAYRYEYADTSGAGLDEDSGDADAAVTKFRLIGAGNSGPDPDCNGNADASNNSK